MRVDLAELRETLVDCLESLAENLLGPHNRTRSRRTQWRWGRQGSLSLEIAAYKRGLWHDYESGEGGGPIELIQHVLRCSFDEAITWGADFVGVAPGTNDSALPLHEAERRKLERERQRAQREADAAADECRRIEAARRVWARALTPDATVDTYLVATRGIPRPGDGWLLPSGSAHSTNTGQTRSGTSHAARLPTLPSGASLPPSMDGNLTGQIVCYLNRTYHVLPTKKAVALAQPTQIGHPSLERP